MMVKVSCFSAPPDACRAAVSVLTTAVFIRAVAVVMGVIVTLSIPAT